MNNVITSNKLNVSIIAVAISNTYLDATSLFAYKVIEL